MSGPWGVALFHTTSSAMRAEKVLRQAGLTVKLVPTPRHLSSDCGMALRFPLTELVDVRHLLDVAKVEYAQVVPLGE